MAEVDIQLKRTAQSYKKPLAMTYTLYDVHSLRQYTMSRLQQFMFWIRAYA